MTRPFQGWSNYETWQTALWLLKANTEPCHQATGICERILMEQHDPGRTRSRAAQELERWVRAQRPPLSYPWEHLLLTGLSAVDWPEIAEAILSDLRLFLEEA